MSKILHLVSGEHINYLQCLRIESAFANNWSASHWQIIDLHWQVLICSPLTNYGILSELSSVYNCFVMLLESLL